MCEWLDAMIQTKATLLQLPDVSFGSSRCVGACLSRDCCRCCWSPPTPSSPCSFCFPIMLCLCLRPLRRPTRRQYRSCIAPPVGTFYWVSSGDLNNHEERETDEKGKERRAKGQRWSVRARTRTCACTCRRKMIYTLTGRLQVCKALLPVCDDLACIS